MSEPCGEEIVACWEANPTDIVGRTKMRTLIASWRERGEEVARLRALADERSLVQPIRVDGLGGQKESEK